MSGKICLVGNPNCGKTTLYNLLTGKRERVGNRAGVTVGEKRSPYKKDKSVTVTDLPGTYSLKAASLDEKAVTEYLAFSDDVIVNVIDGSYIGRSLRLTAELALLNKPMVVAINMCDELEKRGIKIDEKKLSEKLGVPVVKISAAKNLNVAALMETAIKRARVPIPIAGGDADAFIAETVKSCVRYSGEKATFTDKADRILMNAHIGIPLFILIIICVYLLTSLIGGFLGGIISDVFAAIKKSLYARLAGGGNSWFFDLTCNAVIGGVGAVLSFLPQICVLFFLLEILEECGYMSRAAFLLDGIMQKVGLGGKSLIALGVSCGCTVGGIMTTRTVEDDKRRKLTVFLAPFMPCGAKTAVFAWMSGLLFGGNPFVSASMYFISVCAVAVFGAVLKKPFKISEKSRFIMEIPVLRAPSLRGIAGVLREKVADFTLKAGSVIFAVSVAVWFLQHFGTNGYTTEVSGSFLFFIGDKIKYLFVPLGFGSWEIAVAAVTGILARESVIQTLTVVSASPAALFSSAYAAFGFMAFVLMMPPCVAALGAAKSELKCRKEFAVMIIFQILAAYSVSLIINLFGMAAEAAGWAFLPLTIIAAGFIISVIVIIKRRGCSGCAACGVKKCVKRGKANTTL